MPRSTGCPKTTHQWLKPLYTYLDNVIFGVVPSGASGIPNAAWYGKGVPIAQFGNATGVIGFLGNTGLPPVATGGNLGLLATALGVSGTATGVGASGFYYHLGKAGFNGGTGTVYTVNDLVAMAKNFGMLPL